VATHGKYHGLSAAKVVDPLRGLPPSGIPDQNPGQLEADLIVVPPPGNRVRSYLDIVAPDEVRWSEIRPAFTAFASEAQRTPFPWVGVFGRCFFRLAMDQALARQWYVEIAHLYRAAETVRPGP
jgi:hypothetical protein